MTSLFSLQSPLARYIKFKFITLRTTNVVYMFKIKTACLVTDGLRLLCGMLRKYKEENHPVHEVKEEVALHLRLKASLASTIPAVIIIGPFIVQVDALRQFLINKRQEIATKLLTEFAIRMKGLLDGVSRVSISGKLFTGFSEQQ